MSFIHYLGSANTCLQLWSKLIEQEPLNLSYKWLYYYEHTFTDLKNIMKSPRLFPQELIEELKRHTHTHTHQQGLIFCQWVWHSFQLSIRISTTFCAKLTNFETPIPSKSYRRTRMISKRSPCCQRRAPQLCFSAITNAQHKNPVLFTWKIHDSLAVKWHVQLCFCCKMAPQTSSTKLELEQFILLSLEHTYYYH